MMRHLRRLVLCPLALLLALVAAGCGGSKEAAGTSLPVLEDFEPVAAATAKVDTSRFEMELGMEIPGFGQELTFTATGASDTQSGTGEMTMDLSSFAELMGGLAGSLGGNAPEGFDDPENWKLEMRLDGTVAYMRMPFLASELPAGKEWVRVDFEQLGKLGGFDYADLTDLAKQSDPREYLDFLTAASNGVTRLGTEKVRGVDTTHYFAVVDFQKALAELEKKSGQSGLFSQLGAAAASLQSAPVDVWVDADNLVRRMKMDLAYSAPGQGEATMSLWMELFDYGKPVSVEAPPASDVVDLSKLTD